jgi:hypothetical protein
VYLNSESSTVMLLQAILAFGKGDNAHFCSTYRSRACRNKHDLDTLYGQAVGWLWFTRPKAMT